jgi:moderate conductance mechanosensitive channel
VTEPAVGTVEDVTLRVTRIRSVSGEVITTPNGQVTQVTNLSRDWARAVIDVPVPAAVEVSRVTEVLNTIAPVAMNASSSIRQPVR